MSTPALNALVHTMRYEAKGIVSLELHPAMGDAVFPAFEPGAHIDLHLPNGLVRNYSLLNPATERQRYVVGVLDDRNSRGGSRYVHQQLRVGMVLPVSAPRNNFPLCESAQHSVLLAGGIGVTPMLSMLQSLAARARQVEFIYCARSRSEAAFVRKIESYAGLPGVRLRWHFDEEEEGPPDLRQLLAGHTADTHLYGCGPAPMLDAFERTCEELGYANVHIERFAVSSASVSAVAERVADELNGYCVELRRSGKTLQVPVGVSLLDALLEAGISHDYSCKEGLCGACETRVLAGEVDHRDSILTKSERAANNTMMVCVSRCKRGPLVLDI
ncbi:PDR/VanB family oxidoreductase [Paralcaligenes ginsengisoli]|jgi:ferredoxin-NADP reductase